MILTKGINRNKLIGNELKKYRQKKKILHLLYQYHTLSGTSISSKLGVSFPTALTLLNELSELKFVEPFGTGVSSGGRKPNMYRLSNNSIYIIACEFGRYKAKMTIYNSHNQPVTSILTFETNIDDNELAEKIYANAQSLIQEFKIDENRIYGIGLNMPG
ncbi:MAG TPA: hypothetical protein VK872_00235, partial [Draconibacterium sp.]|nr:hypothetical protein [Draconibacterium sp.]